MNFYKILFLFLILTNGLNAQKKELKAIQKLVDSSQFEKAIESLASIEKIISTSEPKYSSHYYY
jgi:hypothetical protein